jgi:hypothetical protein
MLSSCQSRKIELYDKKIAHSKVSMFLSILTPLEKYDNNRKLFILTIKKLKSKRKNIDNSHFSILFYNF